MGFIFVTLMIVLVSVENDSFHETPVLDFLTWVNRSYLHTVVEKIVLSSYFLPEDTHPFQNLSPNLPASLTVSPVVFNPKHAPKEWESFQEQ